MNFCYEFRIFDNSEQAHKQFLPLTSKIMNNAELERIGLLLCNTFNQIKAVIKKRNSLIMILTLAQSSGQHVYSV